MLLVEGLVCVLSTVDYDSKRLLLSVLIPQYMNHPTLSCSNLLVPLVYLSLSGTNYLTSNPEIVISSIGDAKEDALVCHTDLATCCRADNDPTNPDRVGRGDWMFPNGTVLPAGTTVTSDTNVTYRTRDKAVIRLHRRGTITTPTGTYCCMIPTSGGGRTFCANLGELM